MSLIFDALRKASEEEDERRHGGQGLLLRESPYDRRTVDLERRRLRQARRRPWLWAALGAGAVALIGAGFVCAYVFLKSGNTPEGPLRQASPTQADNRVSVEPLDWSAAVDEPPALGERSNLLPHPYAIEVRYGTPQAPAAPASGVIYPEETPILIPGEGALPLLIPETPETPKAATPRPAPARPAEPEFQLGPIVWDESEPMAMVNRKTVTVGDKVSGATIVEINPSSVTIEFNGKRITLKN